MDETSDSFLYAGHFTHIPVDYTNSVIHSFSIDPPGFSLDIAQTFHEYKILCITIYRYDYKLPQNSLENNL